MIQALFLVAILSAEPLTGRVTRVTDGDTIRVLIDRQEVIVRLAGIDAPEARQPFGSKAREALANLVLQKQVTVEPTGRKHFERVIATVFVDGLNVNEEMVRRGFAWQYLRFDQSEKLRRLEFEARESSLGLWAGEAVEPWEWRATRKSR